MIANHLQLWRSKKGSRGINKARLARDLRVSRSHVTRLEKGEAQPSAEFMFEVADYFKCRIEDVFYRQKEEAEK